MTPKLRFCPACAGPLAASEIAGQGWHPACSTCGFVLWQNLKPCADALIVRTAGDKPEVLLGRRKEAPNAGLWDTPGGFLNAGDTPHSRLALECRAESGVAVRIGELVGALTGAFGNIPTITLFYRCEVESGEPKPGGVVDSVQWFPLDALPPLAFTEAQQALDLLRERVSQSAAQAVQS